MKRNFFTLLITVAIIFGMWTVFSIKNREKKIEVLTIKPTLENIYDYINASGKIKESDKHNVYIDAPAEVTKVFVKIGERVKKGQTIAETIAVKTEAKDFRGIDVGLEDIIAVFEEYEGESSFLKVNSEVVEVSEKKEIITSPIDGVITDIDIKEGERVSVLKKLFTVSDFSKLYVEVLVPEEYSSKIKENKSVVISAEAFGSKKYKGNIRSVAPVARYVPSLMGDGKTYIEACVSLDKEDSLLMPGLTVNAKIISQTIENAIILPYECILQDEKNREYVFCLNNGVAEKKLVSTGYELDSGVEIKSGITQNDLVIINPSEELIKNPGIKVERVD